MFVNNDLQSPDRTQPDHGIMQRLIINNSQLLTYVNKNITVLLMN